MCEHCKALADSLRALLDLALSDVEGMSESEYCAKEAELIEAGQAALARYDGGQR